MYVTITLIVILSLSEVRFSYATGVIATINVGGAPSGLVFDPSTSDIYVASHGGSDIPVIDGATNSVNGTIPFSGGAYQMVFANGTLYASSFDSKVVQVINSSTKSGIANITGINDVIGLAFDPAKADVYAATSNGTVAVISEATNSLIGKIVVGSTSNAIGVDSANNETYVVNDQTNSVYAINDSTNTVVANITVGISPDAVAFDPSNGKVFVANGVLTNTSNSGSVSIINGTTNSVVATVDTDGNPAAVAFDSANGFVYVANVNTGSLTVINAVTNSKVSTIQVVPGSSSSTNGVIFDSTNGDLYVANRGSGTVSVVAPAATSSGQTTSPTLSSSTG